MAQKPNTHFHLAQQMEQARVARESVRKPFEMLDGKGVEQGDAEQGSGNPLKGGGCHVFAVAKKPRGGPTSA